MNTAPERMVSMREALSGIDKTELPLIEGLMRPTRSFFSKEENPLAVGSIIVRPIRVMNSKRMVFEDVLFGKTENKAEKVVTVFKAYQTAEHFTDAWVVKGAKDKGLVCFCNGELPENWQAFEVISMNKENTAAGVKVITGGMEKALEHYRIKDIVFPANTGIIQKQ